MSTSRNAQESVARLIWEISGSTIAMGDILPFRKRRAQDKNTGLCRHGFHRWKIFNDKQFDVQRGKLVTVHRCERCGIEKVTLA